MPFEVCVEFESLNLGFVHHTTEIREQIKLGKAPHFREDEQGTVWYKNRICVPDVDGIKKLILGEAHDTAYSIHRAVRWYGMKRAVAGICRKVCDTCRCVKAEHRDLQIRVEMGGNKYGFHCGVTRDSKGYNSIRVVVDRLTKVAHFIPRELYISGIVCLHGVPKRIISIEVHSSHLVFGSELHDSLDSKLRFGKAYHPRTDGRTERTNRILEDMLRACAIQYGTSCDKSPPYAEFSYNNGYQASPKKSPFEAPYGEGAGDRYFGTKRERSEVFGPDLIGDLEQQIKMLLGPDKRAMRMCDARDLTFKVDDFVYLKVSPMRGIRRKPSPRYIGPFKIVERKGEVAYKLELPSNLSGIHNVFHVSQLKKCLRVPEEQAPFGRSGCAGGFDIYRTPGEDS
ncbi:hypothetical protein U9M48_003830 [Paspalum notatum var. saurae]|uniref:Tf2-1-like SH3-like domain-containing protein n=1 Tax=Paspalum notatum var. saurae TaxID=547442 RepID=A0AAQ3SEA3_PASNO